MTRAAIVLVLGALLALGAGACGGGTNARSASLVGDQGAHSTTASELSGVGTAIGGYGSALDASDAGAISRLVKRYYAAAAAENGRLACSLTYYIEAETLPERYGVPPGPRWLRGASTCPVLLSRVFEHFHRQLVGPVDVMAVRVKKGVAEALVSFPGLPNGVVRARREGGSWKVDGLLAVAPE